MGSEYNFKMLWETREVTYEPLDWLAKDIPVVISQYAIDANNLLDLPNWRHLK